jgi:lysophospholipase L1-like esterase
VAARTVNVSQTTGNEGAPALGPTAVIMPTPRGRGVSPNPASLADIASVWGWRRDTWTRQTAGYLGTTDANGSWWVPVSRDHRASTLNAAGICGLHFRFDGRAFELLMAGSDPAVTLLADGRYMAPRVIKTSWMDGSAGSKLAQPNAYLMFDFGSAAERRIALYARSSQGPCAIAVGSSDSLQAWDRSDEPSISVITDSYGGASGPNWGDSGPFWEAAALLGIPHLDLNAMGGTGYAPNNATNDSRDSGNRFAARLPDTTNASPDLFITAGGLNDNNSQAALPLYATADEARMRFENEVFAHFHALRTALPNAVLVALGPWTPPRDPSSDAVLQSKVDTIRSALQAQAGPWVFVDNVNGGWLNSAGARDSSGSRWQTGRGDVGHPAGDGGNSDLYISADGTHPNEAGCSDLAGKLAQALKPAILAL